jgi:alkylation response protein AidB-like acyl-CoA dehydrogenase
MNVQNAPGLGSAFLFTDMDPADVGVPEMAAPEAREFQRTVRAFLAEEVAPQIGALDHGDGSGVPPLLRKLGNLGFFAAEVAEEFGGLGMTLVNVLPMLEELGRVGGFGVAAMVHQGIGMQPLLLVGGEDIARRYAAPLMSAELIAAYALTEPGAGSDALNGTTTATFDAARNEWTINGAKQFITNARWASLFMVFAQVKDKGFSAFLVERGTPGLEVLAEEDKMGIKCSSTCALRLKDVKVPGGRTLGALGRGHKIALNMLNIGRLKLGTTMLGAMKEVLMHAVRYGSERRQFGQQLTQFGLIRRKIAEMGALTFACEAMAYRTAAGIDRHIDTHADLNLSAGESKFMAAEEYAAECSIVKCYLSEAAHVCADHAVQVYGGYGFCEEYPVAKFYRDVRVARLYEGTNEINRLNVLNSIFRRMYKGGEEERFVALANEAAEGRSNGPCAPLRQAFGILFRAILQASPGRQPRLEQDVLGAMAEIAMELFAADSSTHRARRIAEGGAEPPKAELAEALAALVRARSAAIVRERAGMVAEAIGARTGELDAVLDACSRLADGRLPLERAAAALLLRHEGEWPDFAC